ncbi:hypothetical protein LguiB_005054 [Lonicera macranthoides]
MTAHYPTDVDSVASDSLPSSPRSDHHSSKFSNDTVLPRVRFMCSFGGKILPRPHDNQLRYVGGDTRIVAVNRHSTFSSLLNKLSKLSGITSLTVKYQLPNEDLDALITVSCDEDVDNMLEEYERIALNHIPNSKTARLRLFLFSTDSVSRASSISSLLDGSAKREHWFLDALNGGAGPGLERGRSEVSSIVSEVPDYLFGLDNSDDPPRDPRPRSRLNENVSVSDPGSPNPVISSPFCSTSSSLGTPWVPPIPDLRPVKTKPDNPVPVVEPKEALSNVVAETGEVIMQQSGYIGNPSQNPNPSQMWRYVPGPQYPGQGVQNVPVYYVPGSGHGNVPVHPAPIRSNYAQPYMVQPGQMQMGIHQQVSDMGHGYVRPGPAMEQYDMSGRMVHDGVQPVYYGISNVGAVPVYPGMVAPGGEEIPGTGAEAKPGRVSWSS